MAELSEKDTKLFTTEMVLFELANALSLVELRGKAIILLMNCKRYLMCKSFGQASNYLKRLGRFTAKDRIKNGV